MAVRPAVPADLRAVVAIGRESFFGEDAFGATWLVGKLAQPGTALLVEDAAITLVRGFILTEHHQLGTVVRLIAVLPDARREGIGRLLLASVTGPAWTWIRETNEASQRLFSSMGWVEAEPPRKRRGDWRYYRLDAER